MFNYMRFCNNFFSPLHRPVDVIAFRTLTATWRRFFVSFWKFRSWFNSFFVCRENFFASLVVASQPACETSRPKEATTHDVCVWLSVQSIFFVCWGLGEKKSIKSKVNRRMFCAYHSSIGRSSHMADERVWSHYKYAFTEQREIRNYQNKHKQQRRHVIGADWRTAGEGGRIQK